MFKVNTPRFDSDIHALESLDFYIKSLDGVFRDLDRRFSKVDYENFGSRNFIKIPDNNGMICKIPLDYLI